MSNSLLLLFQILSVLVTVIGLCLAFFHIWVLATKLRRYRGDANVIQPPAVRTEANDRRIHLQTVSDRPADAAMPLPRPTAASVRSR